MTSMFCWYDTNNPFDQRQPIAGVDYVTSSAAVLAPLAENYTGLPWK